MASAARNGKIDNEGRDCDAGVYRVCDLGGTGRISSIICSLANGFGKDVVIVILGVFIGLPTFSIFTRSKSTQAVRN